MKTNWIAIALVLVGMVVWMAGCNSGPKNQTASVSTVTPATKPAQTPGDNAGKDQTEGTTESAQLLAGKTATHAQTITALLAKHQDKAQLQPAVDNAPPPKTPLAQTPDVPIPQQATANQTIQTTKLPANQMVSLASASEKPGHVAQPTATEIPAPLANALSSNDPLDRQLAQRVRDNPRDLASQLDYQLLQFLREQSVPQVAMLSAVPAEDREMLGTILDGLSNFRSGLRAEGNMLLSRKIRPWIEVADRLRSQADLTVSTVALCSKVTTFGVYDPIEPARFQANREHQVILYCEVENFASQINDRKMWQTTLTEEEVLYTEQGMAIWPAKRAPSSILDVSRNRRHDFFVVKMLTLPNNLTVGRYLLKVTIVDQLANHVAEATVPIQVVASGR